MMAGCEPESSDVGGNRSANCATTSAHSMQIFFFIRNTIVCLQKSLQHLTDFPTNWEKVLPKNERRKDQKK